MKPFIKSAVLISAFCSSLSLAQVPENDSPNQIDPIDPITPTLCTSEAQLLCVETVASGYQSVGVGRLGPNCEFPTLPGIVDNELCVGSTPPILPTVCTEEAKILCLEDAEKGTFSTTTVGRVGPNCDFPVLASEVESSFCTDDDLGAK
ncbi:MAG: hypothetical protein EOP07_19105 [Proteobacteria bacterium]|nr:MAG: hypothetical protein EOP07_19105 [Pseudomonadota bacterium]